MLPPAGRTQRAYRLDAQLYTIISCPAEDFSWTQAVAGATMPRGGFGPGRSVPHGNWVKIQLASPRLSAEGAEKVECPHACLTLRALRNGPPRTHSPRRVVRLVRGVNSRCRISRGALQSSCRTGVECPLFRPTSSKKDWRGHEGSSQSKFIVKQGITRSCRIPEAA